jgi:thiamine-phosphate diphosphorylase / hydroxyethylthiazole kinase
MVTRYEPELLDTWQAAVIKGNAGELAALSGSTEVSHGSRPPRPMVDSCSQVASRGVDSVGSGFRDPAGFVKAMARKERPYLCAILCWANAVSKVV